ncbi:hypothetical protein DX933_11635 [Ornithinibacillus gellani]|uniref:hypothetical protein n=1 Tax=Ornithinibacillus gellani TaxID=2293253 RepID=UPI000F47994B|nr:hypothetical protein [Ornithinibacillus gellani]TQS74579.1 hypothetical protein DX933_11635 [Ornithinibacillus gellani]
MDELFDLIFGNPILIIIIIGALYRFFSNAEKEQGEKKEKPWDKPRHAPTPRPARTPSGPRQTASKTMSQAKQQKQTKETTHTTSPTVEEMQQQQLEKLAGKYKTNLNQSASGKKNGHLHHGLGASIDDEVKNPDAINHHKRRFKKQIRNKLNQRGLVDSIVMAEVLGPPRARKPYQTILEQRKK